MGQAPPGASCNSEGRGTIFVKAGEFSDREPLTREWTTKPLKMARKGDVLVCVVGATAGKINLAIDCAIGRSVAAIRPEPAKLDTSYLHHFLATQVLSLRARSQGLAQGVITKDMIAELEISLPPLDEERRIAAILDKADALRQKRKRAIALLDSLTQSIFLEMFGDGIHGPRKFPLSRLQDLCAESDDIRCGPFGTQLNRNEFTEDGIPLWGIKQVNAGFKIPTVEYVSNNKARQLSNYDLRPGDLVMTRKGTIGNCAVYPNDFPAGIMHSDLLRIRLNPVICDPLFLTCQLHLSRDVEQQIKLISGGAIMAGINVGKLKQLRVILPDISLQQEFARVVFTIEGIRSSFVMGLKELNDNFASLQHRAFSGQL